MTPDGNPLLGPDAGRAGVLDGGRAVAERLRRRRRDRQDDRRVDHDRRDRAGRARLPGVAVRRAPTATPPMSRPRAARPTSTTTGCATRWTPTSGAARRLSPLHGRTQDLGAVFGAKNGWERPDYSSRAAVAAGGRRPARRTAGRDRRSSTAGRGAPRVPRAGRDHRHDVVRQDRGRGARGAPRCSTACA